MSDLVSVLKIILTYEVSADNPCRPTLRSIFGSIVPSFWNETRGNPNSAMSPIDQLPADS